MHSEEQGTAEAMIAAAGGKVVAVLDFGGSSAAAATAFDCLRKGGRMVQVGMFEGELITPLPLERQAITIQGSITGSLLDLDDNVKMARSGRLPAAPVMQLLQLPMDQANHALDRLQRGVAGGRLVLRR